MHYSVGSDFQLHGLIGIALLRSAIDDVRTGLYQVKASQCLVL